MYPSNLVVGVLIILQASADALAQKYSFLIEKVRYQLRNMPLGEQQACLKIEQKVSSRKKRIGTKNI